MANPYPEKPRYTLSQAKAEHVEPATQPLPELSEAEFDRTAALKQLHQELMPEFSEFVQELYKEGLVPGWRALLSVERINEPPLNDGQDPAD